MINVLVVEDSPVVREYLVHILSSDPEVRVIGCAANGEEALEAVKNKKPDVITMDIHMPKMDGVEATRAIMQTAPTPIVIVSGSTSVQEAATAFGALEAGALAVLERPAGVGHRDHSEMVAKLVETVKLMSEVKVVRRWARRTPRGAKPERLEERFQSAPGEIQLVAMGASTGGPQALQTILGALPQDFPVPTLVVQHIAPGFTDGFVEWLSGTSKLSIHVARQGETILPGHVVVAPDGFQMKVGRDARISLTTDEPENGLRPSVSCLFRSVANVYARNAIGVLLTGMGKDGAEELKLMREKGAVTIAQDEESSVVHGMPGEAISLQAATYVLSADEIASALGSLVKKK